MQKVSFFKSKFEAILKKRNKIALSLIAFTCLGVSFLPTLLSTQAGSRVLSQILSDKTHSKVHLQGDFSWIHPQKIQSVHVASNYFILDLENIILDKGLLSIFFSKNPLEIDVEKSELYWKKNDLITKKQASLFLYNPPFFLSKTIRLNLINGSILQGEKVERVLENVNGFFELKDKTRLQGKLNGSSIDAGSLNLILDFDLDKIDGTCDLDLKHCSKDVLFDFPLKDSLSSFFDLTLSYKGNLKEGAGDAYLAFDNLNLSSSFLLQDKVIVSKSPLFCSFKANSVVQSLFSAQELNLDLTAQNFAFNLISMQMNELDVKFDLFLKQLNLENINYGDITLNAFTKKTGALFDGELSFFQNEKKIVDVICQNLNPNLEQGTFSINAESFPLSNFKASSQLGNTLDGKLDLKFNQQIASFSLNLKTDKIQKLLSTGSFQNFILNLNTLEAFFSKDLFNFAVNSGSCSYNLHKKELSNLQIDSTLSCIDPKISTFFPVNIKAMGLSSQKIDLKVNSKNLTLDGPFSLDLEKQTIKVLSGMQGSLTFDPKVFNPSLKLDPLSASIFIKSGSKLEDLQAELILDPIKLDDNQTYSLSSGKIAINTNLLENSLQGSFYGQIKGINHKGDLQTNFKIDSGKLNSLNLKIDNPPLEAIAYLNEDLKKAADFFGKGLKVVLNFQDSASEKLIDLDLSSENIKCQSSFSLADRLTLKKKAILDVKLYDLDFPFISYKPPFELKKQALCRLELDTLNLDLKYLDFENLGLKGNLSITQLYLSKNKANLQLEGFLGKLEKNEKDSKISFTSSGDLFSNYDKNITTGHLALNIQSSGLQGKLHNLDFSNFKLDSQLKLDQLPTLILDFLLSQDKFPISESFGPTINGNIELNHASDKGQFKALIHSNEALLKFNAEKKGALYYLNEDAICQFNLSSELSKMLFAKKPLGIEKMASDQLIAFRLKQNGTKFSLFPFKTTDLSFDDCRVDLGKIQLVADDIVPQVLAILKASPSKNVSIWFQPIKISSRNGFLMVDRFDFLLQDRFQIALWGQVDLNKEILGLVLGLPSLTLQRAFGITGLPSDYVVQVPISGSFENVEIDSKGAATKIAVILALQKGGDLVERFGGKQGGAIGGMMKSLSRLPDFDKKAPAANTPFPWDTHKEKSDEPKQRKKKVSSKDSPVKQLMKMFF
jgi:hypothetical protein